MGLRKFAERAGLDAGNAPHDCRGLSEAEPLPLDPGDDLAGRIVRRCSLRLLDRAPPRLLNIVYVGASGRRHAQRQSQQRVQRCPVVFRVRTMAW
jgi:hypothetical protein